MEQHGTLFVQAGRFSAKISKLFDILTTILFLPFGVLFFNRKKILAYFLSFTLLFSQTAWAFNDIVPPKNIVDNPIHHIEVDPDRAGNTHLDRAQNGTPVVNINAASNGGVSANYYRDFNVNEENLILNNYKGDAAVSQLGGALYGNPNFNAPGAKAADIILNEVTSSRVTNLNGYTEIFGKQAELIIANPNGEKVEVLVPQVYLCQSTLDELYSAALAREDTQTSIRGDSVTIEALDKEAQSVITNSGMIVGNRELVISMDEINNAATSIGNQQPVLRGGDLLVLNTGADGVVNNLGGVIETTNTGSSLKITTGELNNITLAQQETMDKGDYKKTETHIGGTATISSAGDMSLTTAGDLNMAGSKISAADDATLNVGGDLNSLAIQDYEYEYSKVEDKGTFSSKTTTDIKESVRNIGSEISTGGNLILTVDGDATFAGTAINAGGDADFEVGGDTNILAVVDYDYSYHNEDKSSWGGLVKEKHTTEDSAQHLKGASLNVQEGLTINTGGSLNLVASEANVGGDADITAGEDINIVSADEVSTHYEKHEKTSYLAGLSLDAGCKGSKCSAELTIGKTTTDTSQTTKSNAIGSALNVGGDLKLDAGNDINIHGSDIAIGGDGEISAGNDINVTAAQNTSSSSSSHEDTEIKVGVSVGNAYYDAGLAAKELVDAQVKLAEAIRSLSDMNSLYNEGKASLTAVREAEANMAIAYLNIANAEAAAISSVVGAVAAASSSFGSGIYASASLNYDTDKKSQSETGTQSVASNIFGNNITFKSGNDMTQSGSNVVANDTIEYDIANDLNVLASTDTYETTSKKEHINASVSVGNNSAQVSAGYSSSQETASGTINNNSNVFANNIVVKTGGDATFAGANVHGTESLEMEVDGDFVVESVQDTDYANGSNWGVNASGGSSSGGGGFNVGNNDHDGAWVNDMTELTSGKVNISVSGKTKIIGAKMAAGEYDENEEFRDNENLTLNTSDIEYQDLDDFNSDHKGGFGINTNVGGSTDKQTEAFHVKGKTSIFMKDKSSEQEQITRATIGNGSIIVGETSNPDLAGLNRDVNNMQEITKDKITGALDSTSTVDHEMAFTRPLDILTSPWNAPNTTIGLVNGLANVYYGAVAGPYTIKDENGSVTKTIPLQASVTDDGIFRLTGGRLNIGNGAAISLGNVVTYYRNARPDEVAPSYDRKYLTIREDHEEIGGHVSQSGVLGPAYLPLYLISGANSAENWMERQADRSGNNMYKQKYGNQ